MNVHQILWKLYGPTRARRRRPIRVRPTLETLEDRTVLTGSATLFGPHPAFNSPSADPPPVQEFGALFAGRDPALAAAAWLDVAGPAARKDGPLARVGFELAYLHHEFRAFQSTGRGSFSPANRDLQLSEGSVLVDLHAVDDARTAILLQNLGTLGVQVTAWAANRISGWVPLGAIDDLAALPTLNGATVIYKPLTRIGDVDSQGDRAQRSDEVQRFLDFN